jgi:ribonuclease J
MVEITCYGGVGEIGGNKFLVDTADGSLLLDFGFSFGAEGEYFEEYLQPRSNAKLHDLLELGLLPDVDGLYREDTLEPDGIADVDDSHAKELWSSDLQSYETAQAVEDWTPDAVFLSHAHLDHTGYLPYLGPMPVLCSERTETLLKAIPEVSPMGGFDAEFFEIERREVDTYSSGYFPGEPKLTKTDTSERPVHHTGHRDQTTIPGTNIEVETFRVGHSIPGARTAVIHADGVQILYTGDIRFHGRTEVDLRTELAGLQPDAMLCEGTRINESEPDDEQQVEDDLADEIADAEELVLVAFAWKDLERYETVKAAAQRTGRTPVFDPRLAYLKARLSESIYDDGARAFVERSGSMLYSSGDYTRAKHKAGEMPVSAWSSSDDQKDTIHLENGVTAREVQANPDEYVLHLDFYRFQNLLDLRPPDGSVFVRAQTEPFNDSMELSEQRLINWLEHYDINPDNNHEPIQIHASGHAAGTEIKDLIEVVEPELLIPVHTEHPDVFENPTGEVAQPVEGVSITI